MEEKRLINQPVCNTIQCGPIIISSWDLTTSELISHIKGIIVDESFKEFFNSSGIKKQIGNNSYLG